MLLEYVDKLMRNTKIISMKAKGLVNKILGLFDLKIIGTTDVFEWSGASYKLPLKTWSSPEWMQDSNNNIVPIKFTNEEDRNFVIRAVNRALANPNLRASSILHLQDVNVRFSSSEVRNIALELKNAALYAHSHKFTRFELQDSLNKVIKKWNVNAR